MMGRVCWIAFVVCFFIACQEVGADDTDEQRNAANNAATGRTTTCSQLCRSFGVENGCAYAPRSVPKEEVVVVTTGESNIMTWKWDTITMVVSTFFSSSMKTGRTACVTHSKGKRYGLKEHVPADMDKIVNETQSVKTKFAGMIKTYQQLLMADHIVFDLLDFFTKLETTSHLNKSLALAKITEILSHATQTVKSLHDREVFCIVPWEPPCDSDCKDVKKLLGYCHILLMSPDSYMPTVPTEGQCLAQATVPIARFLYGVDRYIKLQAQPNIRKSIIAGIPWHGYAYKCSQAISADKCIIKGQTSERCFDEKNRQRQSLAYIHSSNIPLAQVKMDQINQALYYNLNESAQLWFENFTTLRIKYGLVKDLELRGLSVWYGEDLTPGMSASKSLFAIDGWDFLTHNILHKAVYSPVKTSHFYADTVAGIGVGCLLLGTALGVTFSCIAFRRNSFQKRNRPFKLDEEEDDFRDDEGL